MNLAEHWENIFTTKDTSQVSWFQDSPATSVRLIEQYGSAEHRVLDVGAGDSFLPDALMERSFKEISVLDISASALQRVQHRLGDRSGSVNCINANVLDLDMNTQFDLWHDRAVFHFMLEESAQRAYKQKLLAHLSDNGVVILATFHSGGGPNRCSGLPVAQHNQQSISDLFGPELLVVSSFDEDHKTPSGLTQKFSWNILKRNK